MVVFAYRRKVRELQMVAIWGGRMDFFIFDS